MKTNYLRLNHWLRYVMPIFALLLIVSCEDDDPMPPGGGGEEADPIASFQTAVSASDFATVTFSNFSQNASSFAWDFGDGNSSTEENPTHTYAAEGSYTVVLTASNTAGASAMFSETIEISDPDAAARILTGTTSKTWKLWREGISMSVGPNSDDPGGFWAGLSNDGARPCLYEQEFTFTPGGEFIFNDNGEFWAEFGLFNNVPNCDVNVTEEQCFEAVAANMVNACGDDISAFLSGTHSFDFDPNAGSLTLNGMGAWIGIPKLGTSGERLTPTGSVTAQVSFEEFTGFDVMTVEFIYAGAYWPIRYASYSDPSLEPALVTEEIPFGEDLPDISPNRLFNDFTDASTADIDTIVSGSFLDYAVPDPTDAALTCGQFNRGPDQFQELQFQTAPMKNDINFENVTTASVEVYLPSTNDYSTGLTKTVIIGFGDRSQNEHWYLDLMQYETDGASLPDDEWVTVSVDLNNPSFVSNTDNGATPFDRNDYDMIFLQIGGNDHTGTGTFFVRNFTIE